MNNHDEYRMSVAIENGEVAQLKQDCRNYLHEVEQLKARIVWLECEAQAQQSAPAGVQGMSKRSKRLDEIRAEAELFFEWPGDDRSTVTLTSCILFADHIAAPSSPAAQGWIPVGERLPEIATDVLVYGVNHGSASYTVAGLFSGSWASQETEETTRFEPTHWMPLPAAPQGGE